MIEPINLRDASYVTSNLCHTDLIEVECQYRAFDSHELAAVMCASEYAFLVRHHGAPAVIFGAQPMCATTVSAWAVGTERGWRCIPRLTRFCLGPLTKQLKQDGFIWAEARSDDRNLIARGWLRRNMGATAVAHLTGYGKHGEDFTLFRRAL